MRATESHNQDVPPLPGDVAEPEPRHEAPQPRRRLTLREEEAEVVRPVVERAILLSGQHDRNVLGSALTSVVGTAFRRSITGVFKRAILRLNRTLVLLFSIDGIRWRFEALQTGKPFKQVVNEHSLTCPVTQVFLIHRRTGLLIGQVQQDSIQSQDGDMVSGMLTAIQDFVYDSFHTETSGQLEVIRIGEVTVLLEQGPFAILAGIVTQRVAPQNLRQTFRRALEQIHEDYHKALVTFKGDTKPFEDITPILETCLKTRMVKGEDRISPLTGVILVVPIVMLGVWGGYEIRQSLRWGRYIEALDHQPGLVVLERGWRGTQRYVRGLRDPLAVDPVGMLVDVGIMPEAVISEWASYSALEPDIVLMRVRRVLDPPPGVVLVLRDGVLSVEGAAPWHWVDGITAYATTIPGITRVRTDGLKREGAQRVEQWKRYLEQLTKTPGILVLETGRRNDGFYIAGMRDPLALDPVTMLAEVGLDAGVVKSKWEAYQALDPAFVLMRARRMLAPPRTVSVALDEGVLRLEGSASHAWIEKADLMVRGLAGVARLDTKQLRDIDLEAAEALIPEIEGHLFYYLADRQNLWPGQETKLRTFLRDVSRFERVVDRLHGGYRIEIRGHTLASGDDDVDQSASVAIAERFYSLLERQAIDMQFFTKRGLGGQPAAAAQKASARKREAHVSFRVIATE